MDLLQPGENIKPQLDSGQVETLLKDIYGITQCEINELSGYDDKNYHIKIKDINLIKNEHIINENINLTDFILKITNSLDSKNHLQFEAHKNIMFYLYDKKFKVQKPLKSIQGEYYTLQNLGTKQHMLRLLTYLPGSLLKSIEITNDLSYKLGVEIGKLNYNLINFNDKFYNDYKSIWMLSEINQLNSFLYVVKDEQKLKLIENCINQFNEKILNKYEIFQKGIIHGDINEQNILVNIDSTKSPQEQFSILDFGDSNYSCVIFDLAIAITYMMIETQSLDIGAYIMAGYSTQRKLPYHELKILKTCITARLCQSLVLGLYTFEQQPNNTYVLGTQDYGWKLLEILYNYESKELVNKWIQIMKDLDNYENGIENEYEDQ